MRTRMLLIVLGTVPGMVAVASGYVGVTDFCPVPTPYPPPTAGPGVVNNPNMEGGFTGGAANQWIGWKDATYTVQVHFDGNDRFSDGTHSQKLYLPQPLPDYKDQEAGIYQQIWVVPGGTYTTTARFYLSAPAEQTYNGEDLVAWLGLDPFGQQSGDGYGMIWSVNVATPNTWITATVTVQAIMPVMTLGLKGTRKFAQHGNEARVWIDQVTFSGPVPTGPRPGPEPDPVDPETLIPGTMGSNLVANSSFEQAFTNGVSAGWNRWWTGTSTGTWKQSQRMGKVGPARYDCGDLNECSYMNPKTVLLMGADPHRDPNGLGVMGDAWKPTGDGLANDPKFQDTIFVGRPYIDLSLPYYEADPVTRGQEYAAQCKHLESLVPRIDCWQAFNEPGTGENWQRTLDFEYAFAQQAHELGLKTCSLNLSTGSPGNIWRMIDETFDPSCRDLLAVADYLGHHVYGGPNDQMMVANQVRDDACSYGLRPRRFKDMYDRRGWRFPPVIATEGSTYGGWIGKISPDQITNDLILMGQYMNADRWWCGYTNFATGVQCNDTWRPWDMIGQRIGDGRLMSQAVGAWNADHPADAMNGLYSQMFGAGEVHPRTTTELTPAGLFDGGINQAVNGLIGGEAYLLVAWVKYEFRGLQPTELEFYLGVDPTGQTSNGDAATIEWGIDQVADKAKVHEIFTHVWRTFTATGPTASIWLRASHPMSNPSFKFYVDMVEVRQLDDAPPAPAIEMIPPTLSHTIRCGTQLPNDSFLIRNGGSPGVITYSLQPNRPWVSVSPTTGTSTGEQDPITVSYNLSGLAPGVHTCTITATAPEASNSGIALIITITVTAPQADFDQDCDVDQEDFGHLQSCMTGPGIVQTDPTCTSADLDPDGDVDSGDWSRFQSCFSGPGIAPDSTCP
jgi:hypothetical protein